MFFGTFLRLGCTANSSLISFGGFLEPPEVTTSVTQAEVETRSSLSCPCNVRWIVCPTPMDLDVGAAETPASLAPARLLRLLFPSLGNRFGSPPGRPSPGRLKGSEVSLRCSSLSLMGRHVSWDRCWAQAHRLYPVLEKCLSPAHPSPAENIGAFPLSRMLRCRVLSI